MKYKWEKTGPDYVVNFNGPGPRRDRSYHHEWHRIHFGECEYSIKLECNVYAPLSSKQNAKAEANIQYDEAIEEWCWFLKLGEETLGSGGSLTTLEDAKEACISAAETEVQKISFLLCEYRMERVPAP